MARRPVINGVRYLPAMAECPARHFCGDTHGLLLNPAACQSWKQQGIEGLGGEFSSQNLAIHLDLDGLRVAIAIDQD